ncbi:MAG TPA: phosphoglucosamine mutase [Oligoflexia bacterium]|nr:phosphoglucosamine mutase [Oligoflexia bacterium]HMP27620.1 phosphoglucosamine mutase [Oligoflexia bacterium]
MNQRKLFGTDGIRGIANQYPLDPETMVKLGKAIAAVLLKEKKKHKPRIVIGKDTRLSGYLIEYSLAAGLVSMGVDVYLMGTLPTPGVAYLTRSMRMDFGVVISASHNAYEDNGVKIFSADGHKLSDDLENEIERMVLDGFEERVADVSSLGKSFRINDHVGRYTVFLKSCFPADYSLDGFKIGLDCANGAAYQVGSQPFHELGAEVVVRGVSPSGKNINSGFGSLFPEVVRELVLEHNLDIGISLDGDADRVVLVDENGLILDGDQILAICAIDLKERGLLKRDTVVATVMSNYGLEKTLSPHGIKVVRTAVGDRYVIEEMKSGGYNFGGEQSGHIVFGDWATTGDGLMTALMVLAIVCRKNKKLSELVEGFVRVPQTLLNVKVDRKIPFEQIKNYSETISKIEKSLMGQGRLLVRYSGTENKVRILVECEDDVFCEKAAAEIARVFENASF